MQIVQMSRKPLVLPGPVRLVFQIHVVEIACDPTIVAARQFLPFERIAEFSFDFFLLPFKKTEALFCVVAGDVAFYPDPALETVRGDPEFKAALSYAVFHPRLRLRFEIAGNWSA